MGGNIWCLSTPFTFMVVTFDHLTNQNLETSNTNMRQTQPQNWYNSIDTWRFFYKENPVFPVWHYRLWIFKTRDAKLERFLHKNQEKYWIWRIGLMESLSSLQKSEVLKLIISFFHYFWCQNWNQCHKMSGKNTHI